MTVVDTVFGKTWKLSASVAGGITNSYNTKMFQFEQINIDFEENLM